MKLLWSRWNTQLIISANIFIALLMFLRLPSVLTLFLLTILYCWDCILQLPRSNFATAEIVVKVILKNHMQLLSKRTAPDYHYVSLIIGNADNSVIFLQKLMWEGNNSGVRHSNFSQKIKWIIKYIDCQNALICLFLRDSVLLRSGSWSRKIEVAKSSKGQEISIHLISSEYGKPWKGTYISHNTVSWYEQWTLYTLKGCFKTRILPLISFL